VAICGIVCGVWLKDAEEFFKSSLKVLESYDVVGVLTAIEGSRVWAGFLSVYPRMVLTLQKFRSYEASNNPRFITRSDGMSPERVDYYLLVGVVFSFF